MDGGFNGNMAYSNEQYLGEDFAPVDQGFGFSQQPTNMLLPQQPSVPQGPNFGWGNVQTGLDGYPDFDMTGFVDEAFSAFPAPSQGMMPPQLSALPPMPYYSMGDVQAVPYSQFNLVADATYQSAQTAAIPASTFGMAQPQMSMAPPAPYFGMGSMMAVSYSQNDFASAGTWGTVLPGAIPAADQGVTQSQPPAYPQAGPSNAGNILAGPTTGQHAFSLPSALVQPHGPLPVPLPTEIAPQYFCRVLQNRNDRKWLSGLTKDEWKAMRPDTKVDPVAYKKYRALDKQWSQRKQRLAASEAKKAQKQAAMTATEETTAASDQAPTPIASASRAPAPTPTPSPALAPVELPLAVVEAPAPAPAPLMPAPVPAPQPEQTRAPSQPA